MEIVNFYKQENFIIDIISAIIISIQSFSFGIFFKRDNFVKAYIKSHLLYVYSAILIIVAEVFLNIAFIIDLFAYISFIMGLINILSWILYNRSKAKLIWQPIIYKGVPFLVLLLLIMYIRIVKDIIYVSWDYLAVYYPNVLRLVDRFLIVPELYLPVFLYGAPLVATEVLSYAILHNIFGAPIFYTIFLILFVIYILRFNFNLVIFVLFNIITFIYFVSYIGYLETPVLFYLLSFLQLLFAPKKGEGVFFVLLIFIVFMLKPYAVFGVIFPLIYIIIQNLTFIKSTLSKKILIIPILLIAGYLLIYQSIVNGIVVTKIFDYQVTTIIITILTIMLFKYDNAVIDIRFAVKDVLIIIPIVLLFIYIYIVDMLYGIVVLPSSTFNMRLNEWIPPIHVDKSNYYTEYYLIILLILIQNFILFIISLHRYRHKYVVDKLLELIVLIGLSYSLVVIIDYFPREYIRRIIPFCFILLLFTASRLPNHIISPVNIYNTSLIALMLFSYYFVEISSSWLEINLLKSINIYVYLLINVYSFLMLFISNKSNVYYRFLQRIEKFMFLFLLLGIFIILYNISHIPMSRELNYFISINNAVLTNDLHLLNNTSVLTCGFFFNKLFGLYSYDLSSINGYLFIYTVIYHNFSITVHGVNSIVILETPIASYCNLLFNNKTLQLFPDIKFLRIP
jgi:hypothetical protein